MSQQEIYQIAHQLKQQGKTPSVALIKSQLSVSMPLAAIIKGLQQWQKNPTLGEIKDDEPSNATDTPLADSTTDLTSVSEQITALQQQVTRMALEITELKKEITALKTR